MEIHSGNPLIPAAEAVAVSVQYCLLIIIPPVMSPVMLLYNRSHGLPLLIKLLPWNREPIISKVQVHWLMLRVIQVSHAMQI